MNLTVKQPCVLVISHLYPSSADPTNGIFIHNHIKALLRAGVKLKVISPVPWVTKALTFRSKWNTYYLNVRSGIYDKVDIERCNTTMFPSPLNWINGFLLAIRLYFLLRKIKRTFAFEYIHSHTITPDGLAGVLLGKWFNVPTICSIRGSDLNEYPHRSYLWLSISRYVLSKSSSIITVSRKLSLDATKMLTFIKPPKTIYNGVDHELFNAKSNKFLLRSRLNLPKDSLIFIYVGRIELDKGIDELIKAFDDLLKKKFDVFLACIGNGGYRRELRKRLSRNKNSTHFIAPGALSQEFIPKYLQASDIFVLPTYSEGMPNALIEAMACELPCIASQVGGIPEIIENGKNGLLIPPKSWKQLKNAMHLLCTSEEKRCTLGKNAGIHVRQHFDWDENAKQHINIYRTLKNG